MNKIEYIYPLTIIKDRYEGAYSGGEFTAWNHKHIYIPTGIDMSDNECACAWGKIKNDDRYLFGIGETPHRSVCNLIEKISMRNRGVTLKNGKTYIIKHDNICKEFSYHDAATLKSDKPLYTVCMDDTLPEGKREYQSVYEFTLKNGSVANFLTSEIFNHE